LKRSVGTVAIVFFAALAMAGVASAQAPMGGGGGFGQDPAAATKKDNNNADVLPEIDPKLGNDVNMTFAHAERAFAARDWLEAIAYYQHVRAKFSYSVSLAALSQLRLGDIAFERVKFLEAKEYYKEFVRMHPNHEKRDYASYRLGLCAYKDIPGELFFQPPSSERDQSEVRTARNTMNDFIKDHPRSEYVSDARDIVVKCDDRLANHEWYVANFYANRKKWAGAVLRSEALVKSYPDSTRVPEALILAITGHNQLKQPDEARKDFDALEALNPPKSMLDRGRAALASGR
jgi:outer membrane protein assembly factor BamD